VSRFSGRTAFITGGAGGFGLALARRFAENGANIMLADIDPAALEHAARALRQTSAKVDTLICDVTERTSMVEAAARTVDRLGNVHFLCNNAGVVASGRIADLKQSDWDWVLSVNVTGVANGIAAFLPGMEAHGEPAQVINTASVAGLKGRPSSGLYCASKSAVIALSEALRAELEGTPIGVTTVCPGFMKTGFFTSGDKRQERFGGPKDIWEAASDEIKDRLTGLLENGLSVDRVADLVVEAIVHHHALLICAPRDRELIGEWFGDVLAAYDRDAVAAASAYG
jgi:NAD(P)-dependent dehydrogenase (short-subunit alcohol dehydrogenase family)